MKGFSVLKIIKDEIIGSENTFQAYSVLAAITLIIAMGFYLNTPNQSFHGIAGSRESVVSFEQPVEVKEVYVIPGQKVKKGELLIELNQFDLDVRIRELNTQINKLKADKLVRDQVAKAVSSGDSSNLEDALSIEIKELVVNKTYLEQRRNNLYVFAEIDGVVGSVNFKKGERAQTFSPIVTISPESPTFVQGFVNEQMQSSIKIGSSVEVESLGSSQSKISGRVVSVGSRIVQIPTRLAPNSGLAGTYGKEVIVEIPKTSPYLLGEHVLISPISGFFTNFSAHAENTEVKEGFREKKPMRINLPPSLENLTRFEASGAVYLEDIKKFLVVSDDTDEKGSPWLFFMSKNGEVDERPLNIPNLSNLEDAESISKEGNYIYVLSSLAEGNGNKQNKFLIRFEKRGFDYSNTKKINFSNLLRAAILKSNDPFILELARNDLRELEIEAHTVHGGDLYLGIKNPTISGDRSLILKIANINKLIDSDKKLEPNLTVWKTFEIQKFQGHEQRMSDIVFIKDSLYFTASCKKQVCGSLMKLNQNESIVNSIRSFSEEKPEGIAYDSEKNEILITFDMGKEGSLYTTYPGPNAL